jgi:hypothetical protein
VAWLRETLAYAVSRAAKVLVGGKVRAEGFGIAIGGRLGELGADLADVVRSLQSTTNLVALGVDLITYRRFMHLAAGAPGVFPNGQVIRSSFAYGTRSAGRAAPHRRRRAKKEVILWAIRSR